MNHQNVLIKKILWPSDFADHDIWRTILQFFELNKLYMGKYIGVIWYIITKNLSICDITDAKKKIFCDDLDSLHV